MCRHFICLRHPPFLYFCWAEFEQGLGSTVSDTTLPFSVATTPRWRHSPHLPNWQLRHRHPPTARGREVKIGMLIARDIFSPVKHGCRATQWKSESVLACRQSHSPVTGELLPLCTLIFFRVCSPSLNIIGMALFEYLQNKPPSEEEKTFCCRCHCHAGNRTVTERRQTNSLRQCREKHSSLPSRIFDVTLLDLLPFLSSKKQKGQK